MPYYVLTSLNFLFKHIKIKLAKGKSTTSKLCNSFMCVAVPNEI